MSAAHFDLRARLATGEPFLFSWMSVPSASLAAQVARLPFDGVCLDMQHGMIGFSDAVPMIARALNLSRADVHGVVTFYHDFRSEPVGRRHVKICRGEACQAMGADAMAARVLQHFGLQWNGTTADGAVTVSPVFCLGLCSVAPAVQLGDALHARVSAETVTRLAEEKA